MRAGLFEVIDVSGFLDGTDESKELITSPEVIDDDLGAPVVYLPLI